MHLHYKFESCWGQSDLFLLFDTTATNLIRISVSQHSNELKDALEAEMEKTRLMEESMKKLDDEMRKSDELLGQMIPKQVHLSMTSLML